MLTGTLEGLGVGEIEEQEEDHVIVINIYLMQKQYKMIFLLLICAITLETFSIIKKEVMGMTLGVFWMASCLANLAYVSLLQQKYNNATINQLFLLIDFYVPLTCSQSQTDMQVSVMLSLISSLALHDMIREDQRFRFQITVSVFMHQIVWTLLQYFTVYDLVQLFLQMLLVIIFVLALFLKIFKKRIQSRTSIGSGKHLEEQESQKSQSIRSRREGILRIQMGGTNDEIKFDSVKSDFFNILPFGLTIYNKQKKVYFFNEKTARIFQSSNADQITFFIEGILEKQRCFQRTPIRKQEVGSKNHKHVSRVYKNSSIQQIQTNIDNRKRNQSVLELLHKSSAAHRNSEQSDMLNNNQSIYFETSLNVFSTVKKLNIQILTGNFEEDCLSESLIFVIQDITKKRYYQTIQEAYLFQKQILESFSHELRTPLNCSILSLQQAITKCDKELFDILQPAYSSNILLLYQLNDILDLAAFESKNFAYNFSTFKSTEILSEITSLFAQKCESKFIKLQVDNALSENIEFYADKNRILQVVVNLINNSIKFSNQGGQISVKIQDYLENNFIIWVEDDGVGLDSQAYDNLVKALQDSDNLRNKEIGLGYRISNKIVSGLNDHIKHLVLQRKQQGLIVWFIVKNHNQQHFSQFKRKLTIPKANIQEIVSINEIQQLRSIKLQKNNLRLRQSSCDCASILIVDDEPFNHIPVTGIFNKLGVKTQSCFNGEEAFTLIKKKYSQHCYCDRKLFSLILMDIQMPVLDGLMATKKFQIINFYKQENVSLKKSPIIICSAFDTEDNLKQAKSVGATDFYPKPLSTEVLKKLFELYLK